MPPTPIPGDPTYENWLQMANSYGMTIDELYQAMVSYPAEQGAGANYSQPTQAPAYDYANRTPAAPAAPAPGMYEGQQYEGYSPWNPISRFFEGAEYITARDLGVQSEYLQGRMDDYHKGLANAKATGVQEEIDFYTRRITETRAEYRGLVQRAQTGAGSFRAAGKIASQPGLIGSYEGLAEQLPGGFNVDIPLALVEPPDAVPGYEEPAAPAGETAGVVKPWGETTAPTTPIAPAEAGPILPWEGAVPSRAGLIGPLAYAGGPTRPEIGEGEGGGGGGGWVETPGGRGFESFAALREGMGTDWRPWRRDIDPSTGQPVGYPRGGTNLIRGTPGQLREFVGDTTPLGYYRGGRDEGRYDFGQGEQNYIIRRDSMGNIRSFTPAGSTSRSPRERLWGMV